MPSHSEFNIKGKQITKSKEKWALSLGENITRSSSKKDGNTDKTMEEMASSDILERAIL